MRTISLVIVVVLLACLTSFLTQEANARDLPVQRWAIDLNSSAEVKNAGPIDANTRINVVYLGQNRIAVALLFPIRVDGKFPPARDQETWRALLLSVEGADGKIQHSFQFDDFHGEGASSEWLQMGVLNSDELLVIFGNELLRFSSDMVPLVRRTLPREMKVRNGLHYYDHWSFLVDCIRDTALLTHASLGGSADNRWISTKDLGDAETAHVGNFLGSRVVLVGRQVIFTNSDPKSKKSTAMVEADGQAVRPLCDGAVLASFGQSLLFLDRRQAASHVVVNLQGQEIYERQRGFGSDRILAASGAVQANRVAFVYGALRGSLFSGWSSNDHIILLDADLKREIEVPNPSNKGVPAGDQAQVFNSLALALSPDGRAVAIAQSARVTLWVVP
jgi:hypothetical protein